MQGLFSRRLMTRLIALSIAPLPIGMCSAFLVAYVIRSRCLQKHSSSRLSSVLFAPLQAISKAPMNFSIFPFLRHCFCSLIHRARFFLVHDFFRSLSTYRCCTAWYMSSSSTMLQLSPLVTRKALNACNHSQIVTV